MGDREGKLNKAREKLEKFRKKKQKLVDPAKSNEDVQSSASSSASPSPVMFQETTDTNIVEQEKDTVDTSATISPAVQEKDTVTSATISPPAASLASYFGSSDTELTGGYQALHSTTQQQLDTIVSNENTYKTCDSLYETKEYDSSMEKPDIVKEMIPLNQTNIKLTMTSLDTPDKTVCSEQMPASNEVALHLVNPVAEAGSYVLETKDYIGDKKAVIEQKDVGITSTEPENIISTTESLKQMSSHLSGLLAEESNFSYTSNLIPQSSYSSKLIELEEKNKELNSLIEAEKQEKENIRDELSILKTEMVELQASAMVEKQTVESKFLEENLKLKTNLDAQSKAIELLVSEKTELEASNTDLRQQNEVLLQQKQSLETSIEQLGSACSDLKFQLQSSGSNSEMLGQMKSETDKELKFLKESLLEKEQSYQELQSKLTKVSSENSTSQVKVEELTSELEMCKVHLTQLRGSGAQDLLNEKDGEILALSKELSVARQNLREAMIRVEHLAGEREQLAEQYRNYNRELANQAERLSEQLRIVQEENGRLVHRESGLVTQVTSLESQLQKLVKEGTTEEEVYKLNDQVVTYEKEVIMNREEKDKLMQVISVKSSQVDEMMEKLALKDDKIMELQATVSGLETTVEMLNSTSHASETDQAHFLAACQSDKVAASRAMQQNIDLKERLEELQGALVTLANNKAELIDQLENANRKVNRFANVEAEITAKDEAVKEREILLINMKKHVRYLEEQLKLRKTPDRDESIKIDIQKIEEEKIANLEKELCQSNDLIRSLNSQNSELRSKLEVLSTRTRDCSESRSNSSSDGRVGNGDSFSSDSFVEIDGDKKSNVTSSDSYVILSDTNDTDTTVDESVIKTVDLPLIPTPEMSNSQTNSNVDILDNEESVRQLENRFMAAMEQLAELSSDKEQLEYLVERLQTETETIGDYVIMYQHQRKMQKLKIQEKEEQVVQLAKDRAELLTKLSQLQELVTELVEYPNKEVGSEGKGEVMADPSEKTCDEKPRPVDKERIIDLIQQIGTGSNQMMAHCEHFEPWFWENSPSKVLTV